MAGRPLQMSGPALAAHRLWRRCHRPLRRIGRRWRCRHRRRRCTRRRCRRRRRHGNRWRGRRHVGTRGRWQVGLCRRQLRVIGRHPGREAGGGELAEREQRDRRDAHADLLDPLPCTIAAITACARTLRRANRRSSSTPALQAARCAAAQPVAPPATSPTTMPTAPPRPVDAHASVPGRRVAGDQHRRRSVADAASDPAMSRDEPTAAPTSALAVKHVAMHASVGAPSHAGHGAKRPWWVTANSSHGASSVGNPASAPATDPLPPPCAAAPAEHAERDRERST